MGGVFEACRYSFAGIRGRVGERGYGVVDGRRGKVLGERGIRVMGFDPEGYDGDEG